MFLTVIKDRNLKFASNVQHHADSNSIVIKINPKQYRINTDSAIVTKAINRIIVSDKVSNWFKEAIYDMSLKKNLTMSCISVD